MDYSANSSRGIRGKRIQSSAHDWGLLTCQGNSVLVKVVRNVEQAYGEQQLQDQLAHKATSNSIGATNSNMSCPTVQHWMITIGHTASQQLGSRLLEHLLDVDSR